MVMMTSAARAASSVSGLGNSFDASSPRSARTSATAGLIASPGAEPGGPHVDAAVRVVVDQHAGGDGAAGVVGADDEHLGDGGHDASCAAGSIGITTAAAVSAASG